MLPVNSSSPLTSFSFNRYRTLVVAVWTTICLTALLYEMRENRKFTERNALTIARIAIEKDMAFRRWGAGHGGVYVPVTEKTPPNPWLQIPERDINTPSGKKLTLMNPAYMTRQLFDQLNASSPEAPRGHLTSLKPVRPNNAPDRWETEALRLFEKGVGEYGDYQVIEGVPYYRYMKPLKTEPACLVCHAAHGYHTGELRGGISVAVPVAELKKSEAKDSAHHSFMFLLSWLAGCSGICFGFRRITKANSSVIAERNNLTSLFDIAPVGMLLLDESGLVVRFNRSALEIAGSSHDLAPPQTFGTLLGCGNCSHEPSSCGYTSGCEGCKFLMAMRQTLKEAKSFSGEHLLLTCMTDYNRSHKWIRFTIAPIRLDERNYALVSLDDVTEYHLTQETLQEQTALLEEEITERLAINETLETQNLELEREMRERLEAERCLTETRNRLNCVFQTIPDLVWLKDEKGVYLACNAAFEEFFGASEAEIIGKTDYDFVDAELADSFRRKDREAVEAGYVCLNEEWITYKNNGRKGLLETRKVPVFGSNDEVIGVLGIARDITEQNSIKEQLLQSQKMESVGRLIGGIAHDFNNILTPIIGYSETLKWSGSLNEQAVVRVDRILRAADRARALVNQLLSFSRKQQMEMHVIDFNKVVASICDMLRSSVRESIDIRFSPSLSHCIVRGGRNQLEQIVMNLIVNAQDAITGNGIIEIETAAISLDEEHVHLHADVKPGRYCRLSVSDTGCGMDAETLEHIFEPFFTTKDTGKGTGLGLATVYGLVRQHNGSISVASTPGHGSVFTILLPAVDLVPLDEPTEVSGTTSVAGNGRNVLVVEDNPMVREMVVELLSDYGFRVYEAETPERALMSICGQSVEILVTDVVMPGMTGPELRERLLSTSPDLKVLFMSGYNNNLIEHQDVTEKSIGFIQKPFTIQELAEKLIAVMT